MVEEGISVAGATGTVDWTMIGVDVGTMTSGVTAGMHAVSISRMATNRKRYFIFCMIHHSALCGSSEIFAFDENVFLR
jgi:hypothetical protein